MNLNKHLSLVILFLLAFIPRAYDLAHFVTADEAKWVYRSAQFLHAFLNADYAATQVNLTPAVTTTWLGSLGLMVYYTLHPLPQPLMEWLLTLPEFRADLTLLVTMRWAFVILSSLCITLYYPLTRHWLPPQVAWVSTALIALDPHTVSLSRVLGHDAPAALSLTLSLITLLCFLNTPTYPLLLLSAISAGLAFLSKAPTLFLIPFAALLLSWRSPHPTLALRHFLLWLIVAYLTVILIWPAAWLHPLSAPYAVVENAFISATDQVEAEAETYWQVPDLGLAYYPIHGLFKLSPLVLGGLLLALFRLRHERPPEITAFLVFALLFTLFMTLGDKRSPRYILPIFPALTFVAVWGWQKLLHFYRPDPATATSFYASLVMGAGLILWPYSPYYFTYYNPLVGGAWTAPHWVKIGWGEGLDEAGRFLEQDFPGQRVSTIYASTVAPYFTGKLSGMDTDKAAAIVLYIKQIQSGEPSIPFIRYFQYQDPLHHVELNGLPYADIYAGPPLTFLDPPHPLAYRPLTPFATISQTLQVDVLWLPTQPPPITPTLTLRHLTHQPNPPLLSPAPLQKLAEEVLLSQHHLFLPATLPPGDYEIIIDERVLGTIALHNFEPPPHVLPEPITFNQHLALISYQFSPTEDYIKVKLTWQALADSLPDYTILVQLLNAQHQPIAELASPPRQGTWPTPRWLKNEIIPDEVNLAVPPALPNGGYEIEISLIDPATQNPLDTWTIPWTFIWEQP